MAYGIFVASYQALLLFGEPLWKLLLDGAIEGGKDGGDIPFLAGFGGCFLHTTSPTGRAVSSGYERSMKPRRGSKC